MSRRKKLQILAHNKGATKAIIICFDNHSSLCSFHYFPLYWHITGSSYRGEDQGAYSVPCPLLEQKLDDVPRNAPKEVLDAVVDVRDEDFIFVSLVEGGYEGWIKSGGRIEKGPIYNTEIKWVRKLEKGEVSMADFRKAASGEDKDAIIVDARTKEEVAELGSFKNTINIPLDEIPARLQEVAQG